MTRYQEKTFPNRLSVLMQQTKRYRNRGGCSSLAADTGLSAQTISDLIHQRTRPRVATVLRIQVALEEQLRRRVRVEEMFPE